MNKVKYLLIVLLLLQNLLLYSQQPVSDRDINRLNIDNGDTAVIAILPHKIQPANLHSASVIKDSLTVVKDLISRTITALNRGNSAMALFHIHEAMNYVPTNDLRSEAIVKSYYGVIQIELGNHIKAVNAMNRCDSIFRELNDESLLAFHYNNLGIFHRKNGNIPMAEQSFFNSLKISRRLNDSPNIAITLNQLAKGGGDPSLRRSYIVEAIEINSKLGDSLSLIENYNNLANIYLQIGLVDSSRHYLLKSGAIAQRMGANIILSDNYEICSRLYASTGQFNEAYEAYRKSVQIKESSKGNYNVADIEQMIENRTIARKNFEIQLKDNDLRIKHLTLLLTAVLSILIIVVLLSFYIYHKRKLQCLEDSEKLAQKEKELVENELVNIATYLNSRNEILKTIQSSLSKAYKLPESEIAQEVRKINIHIKNLLTKDNEVDSVIDRTEKINEDFIIKLTTLHPTITKNEKNIALLLRAGLSTKQIATLLDCNPKSVNMARYRMRGNLGIASDINLSKYLKSL